MRYLPIARSRRLSSAERPVLGRSDRHAIERVAIGRTLVAGSGCLAEQRGASGVELEAEFAAMIPPRSVWRLLGDQLLRAATNSGCGTVTSTAVDGGPGGSRNRGTGRKVLCISSAWRTLCLCRPGSFMGRSHGKWRRPCQPVSARLALASLRAAR